MLVVDELHVGMFRQPCGDGLIAILAGRVRRREHREPQQPTVVEVPHRCREDVIAGRPFGKRIPASRQMRPRGEAVDHRTVLVNERVERVALSRIRWAQDDRNALRHDLRGELDDDPWIALIVLDHEVHGPATNAARLVDRVLNPPVDALLCGRIERQRAGKREEDVDVVRIGRSCRQRRADQDQGA